MVNITITRSCKDKIQSIKASGHALFAPSGKDIVCAGISSILIGGINAIDQMGLIEKCTYEVENGKLVLSIHDCHDTTLQVILCTMYIQLKTIEESYSKYIVIQEV